MAVAGGVLTLLLGGVLLWLFRRRVARLMMAAASKPLPLTPGGPWQEQTARRPAIEMGPPAPSTPAGPTSQAARSVAAAMRHATVVQSVAGLIFAAVATWPSCAPPVSSPISTASS